MLTTEARNFIYALAFVLVVLLAGCATTAPRIDPQATAPLPDKPLWRKAMCLGDEGIKPDNKSAWCQGVGAVGDALNSLPR